MPLKTVTQSQFVQGLNSIMGQFSQQKGTFPAASNMLLTQRGSLQTCDGSGELFSPAATDTSGAGAVLDFVIVPPQLSPVSPGGPSLCWIQECPGSHLNPPTITSVTEISGSWPTGNYAFEITGLGGLGGETTASASFPHTISGSPKGLTINWNPSASSTGLAYATLYNIYVSISSGPFVLIATVPASAPFSGAQTTSFASIPTHGGTQPPAVNSTATTAYRYLPSATQGQVYDNTGIDGPPTQVFFPLPTSPVGTTGIDITGMSGLLTVNGGSLGLMSAVPQIVPFGGASNQQTMYMALGNGLAPLTVVAGGTPAAMSNNFTVYYPTWTASTDYSPGSYVVPTSPNGHFYKAIQAGIGESGGSQPSFRTDGGSVADGPVVVWQDQGSDAIPAPRGAAHMINHLSALWLFNTGVSNSTDGLDGPSMLAQSDINNAQSWPPQYRVKVGSDDGQEGMGLADFTVSEVGIAPSPFMVAFKNYSTYLINGNFTPTTGPNITKLQTDLGCIAPRSIQFLAPLGGIIRLSHKGFSITDGISDDTTIGESIRNYIFGGQTATGNVTPVDPNLIYFSHATQTAGNPPLYVCACPLTGESGKATRLFCLDLILKSWSVVDLPFPIYAVNLQALATYPPAPVTILTGYLDGIFRQWQAGDDTWDSSGESETATPVSWSVMLPNVFKDAGTSANYFRDLLIRGMALSASVSITVQLFAQGVGQTALVTQRYNFTSGQFEARVFPNQRQLNMWAVISGTGRAVIDSLTWTIRPGRESVPASLMVS